MIHKLHNGNNAESQTQTQNSPRLSYETREGNFQFPKSAGKNLPMIYPELIGCENYLPNLLTICKVGVFMASLISTKFSSA